MKDLVRFVNDIKPYTLGFDQLWDDLSHPSLATWDTSFPKDNVIKSDNSITIELALAGYDKDCIEIKRDGSRLTVSANKEEREEDKNVIFVRKHIASRSFTKSYTIAPEYKDSDAKFENGILSITLVKEPEEDTTHKIEIL
jgi:HSP20 family molecular chaperone IbpA